METLDAIYRIFWDVWDFSFLANISWSHCVPLFYCVSVRLLFWRWREIWTINLGVSGDVPVVNAKNWVIGTHDANDYYDDEEEVNYDDEGGMVGWASSGQLQKKLEYMNAYDYYYEDKEYGDVYEKMLTLRW